jgi:hypothetical protein
VETEEANKRDLLNDHAQKSAQPQESIAAQRKRKDAERMLAEVEARKNNIDFERQDGLQYTAEEVAQWEKKQKKRAKRKDTGFADWSEANLRKHHKLIDQIQPDLDTYEVVG